MAFEPDYRQQRADRDRAKAHKKEERLKRREPNQTDADPSQSAGEKTDIDIPSTAGEGSAD